MKKALTKLDHTIDLQKLKLVGEESTIMGGSHQMAPGFFNRFPYLQKPGAWLNRHSLIVGISLMFLFSWIAVLPKIRYPALPEEPFLITGAFVGPFLSAIIIIALTEGKAGLTRFGQRYVQWRAGFVWWLFVLFGLLFALNLVATLFFGFSIWIDFFRNLNVIFPAYTAALLFGAFLGPLWEEGGWRGFALPRLQIQYGPLIGSLILGLMWALWHIPGYLGGWMSVAFPALIISCLGYSIVATWVSNHTSGSILLLVLLHSSSNAAVSVGAFILPQSLSVGLNHFIYAGWIPAITNGILAIIVLVFTKGSLSYQVGPKTITHFTEGATHSS